MTIFNNATPNDICVAIRSEAADAGDRAGDYAAA